MEKKSSFFRADYFCYTLILFGLLTYLTPYTVSSEPVNNISVGYPAEWLVAYDLTMSDHFSSSTAIDPFALIGNIFYYYLFVSITGYLFRYIKEKFKKQA